MAKFMEFVPDMEEEELEWNLENFVDIRFETFTVRDEHATYTTVLMVPKQNAFRKSLQFAGLEHHWVTVRHLPLQTQLP